MAPQIDRVIQMRSERSGLSYSAVVELALMATANHQLVWDDIYGWVMRPPEWQRD